MLPLNITTSFPQDLENIIGVGWAESQGAYTIPPDALIRVENGKFLSPEFNCKQRSN